MPEQVGGALARHCPAHSLPVVRYVLLVIELDFVARLKVAEFTKS